MCEINSHGGSFVERAILEECLKNGAVLAEAGEFTKRAFLNGRIDLSQAEAVMDVINSKSESERKASINQLEGKLSKKIKEIEGLLLDVMADIEASIDYPEYDIEETTNKKLKEVIEKIEFKLVKLQESYNQGKLIRNGINTAIIGKPNVGKSSLLNLLLNEERAIVSEVEGTTRDTIEEYINLKGITLKIIDTAGIRKTNDEIEKIGVEKAINIINNADLIISIFDDSRAFDDEDKKIVELIKNKKSIVLLNKADLNCSMIDTKKYFEPNQRIIRFSTKTEEGLELLYSNIVQMFDINEIGLSSEDMITNIRQKNHIDNAIQDIEELKKVIDMNETVDISAIYIKQILEELESITGGNVSEDIINEIFSKFCLGK